MTLNAKVQMPLNITHSKELDLTEVKQALTNTLGVSFTDGALADQAEVLYHDKRALGDAANETIDLQDGSLSDAFGDAITIEKLKFLYIKNLSTTANLLVGAAAGNQLALFADPASDKLSLPPLGEFIFIAPDLTGLDTSANADLKLEHDGTGDSAPGYKIIAIGVD